MGYIGDISLVLKFKWPFLSPMWNRLFTLPFKSFSERVVGSNNASKLFYTIIYGLYHGINLDYGLILCTKLIQSTASTTRNIENLCAQFWSLIVKQYLNHYMVQLMTDSFLAAISILQTSTFMMSDPNKFNLVGSIPEAMLGKVPSDNAIVNEYHKQPSSGVFLMSHELQKAIEEAQKQRRGGKRKVKASPSKSKKGN